MFVYVVEADVPLIVILDVFKREKILVNYIDDVLESRTFGWTNPLT